MPTLFSLKSDRSLPGRSPDGENSEAACPSVGQSHDLAPRARRGNRPADFQGYLALGCVPKLQAGLDARRTPSKQRFLASGRVLGGCSFGRGRTFLARSTFAVGNEVLVAMDSEAVCREGHPLPAT